MNSTKRGLGRGLDALLATSAKAQSRLDEDASTSLNSPLQHLAISQLVAGAYQPRKEMDLASLEELAESIRSQGIIQPLVVRHLKEDIYEIIAGERRFQAAKLAELTHVPCLVRVLDNKEASAIALIENIQRENLNVMEEAQALSRLIDEFSLTHQQLGETLGKSRTTISNILRLNSLTSTVKDMLFNKQLEMGHGRALLALDDKAQAEAALIAVNRKYTVRQTESLVKKMLASPHKSKNDTDQIVELQDKLSAKLGVSVTLNQKANGKGKLVIDFDDKVKLERVIALLNGS